MGKGEIKKKKRWKEGKEVEKGRSKGGRGIIGTDVEKERGTEGERKRKKWKGGWKEENKDYG